MNFSKLPGIYSKPIQSLPIDWHGKPVKVVSLGCGDKSVLADLSMADIADADVIYGSSHHLTEIVHLQTRADKCLLPTPFSDLRNKLQAAQQKNIVILASGDALFYGVGSWLNRVIGNENLIFRPHISSIQYAFHAIGRPWQQAEIVSLHGRPLHSIRRHIKPHHLLAVFTDSHCTPLVIADEICKQGYEHATIWVCESMGQASEKVRQFEAGALAVYNDSIAALNLCIIELKASSKPKEQTLSGFPGIPDSQFITGAEPGFGMISKREIRLSILAMMAPCNHEIAWDIGAGCGSVSVEWARWNNQGQIYAIEQSERRVDHIINNSEKFGTTLNLTPIQGIAPQCCEVLPDPDSIFVGGSGGLGPILQYAWDRLKRGGKLVASAVTEKSKSDLHAFMEDKSERQWITMEIEKNLPGSEDTRHLKPVCVARCIKPDNLT